ncbi:hypothetical protein IW261DRAFT_1571114 [Armillaria novae-zelandiae]|uniref:Autophagy-related protein 27 n=1 Tax=Armillaria novae-zelandiae TaxID=153914 RepID=A0AA39NUU5_9AGAR|nr:hypothetical protein IW261DRAFT_1571114 [Armillaria novae-zelandiae]
MHFFLWTLLSFISVVSASHTIRFFNYCGSGTPTIYTHGKRTSVDSRTTYSSNNDNDGVIYTFLEQGSCGNDGRKCTTVGVNLTIPEASFSKTNKYSVPLSLQCVTLPSHCYILITPLEDTPVPMAASAFLNAIPQTAHPRPYHAIPLMYDSFLSSSYSLLTLSLALLILTPYLRLGSPLITNPKDSSPSSTLIRKLIAPIIIIIILIIALVGTILFLRRKNLRLRMETTMEATPRIPVSRGSNPPYPRRPERASILTVPSYQSTCVASTINKESWEDFKSGSYFVKLYPTGSEMSVFED